MTNTLHRFGSADSFHDDFIVFAMACIEEHERIGQRSNDRKLIERREDRCRVTCSRVLDIVDERRFVIMRPHLIAIRLVLASG